MYIRRPYRIAALLLCCLILFPFTRIFALNRYLRVGVNCSLPPFQFLDDDGECVGMHIDMLNAIAKENSYEIDFVPYSSNTDCIKALDSGSIDIVLGMIPTAIKDVKNFVCTDALTSSQLCMIVSNASIESDKPITTAMFSSDTIQHTLLANLGIHQFIAVGNQTMVYQRHKECPHSAMIGVKDSLVYQLQQDGTYDEYTVQKNYLGAIEFCLVVRSSDSELLRTANRNIAKLKATAQYESICSKWLPADDMEAKVQRLTRIILTASTVIAAAVFIYIIITRRMQHILKMRVAEQTKQIQAANDELERQFVQLKNENDLRNRIIKYSPSGMLLFDINYNITMANKSACLIAGLSNSPVGHSALNIPVFCDIIRQEGDAVFTKGALIEGGKISLGDSPISINTYSYMMHQIIRYGIVEGILLTVQDITKTERLQQEEFERNKNMALTRIAAGIAHEIRNPLMTIRTFATLIGTKGDNKQVQESFARYVPNEVDRINRIVDNLIHYAKPAKLYLERVNVSDIVDDSLSLIRPVLRKSSFNLIHETKSDIYIMADRDKLKQVMINIFMNGIEAMEYKRAALENCPELTLIVRITEEAGKVYIVIRDEGIGMTESELAACRDPFFSTKKAGTGLGLALCEQYIKENNGAMQIDSVKNQYTRISLIFERS